MPKIYDLIIIGGGPAGVAAGVYGARKKLKVLLITESFGGQSAVSNTIENWIGATSISGTDLAKGLEKHIRAQKDIEIKELEKVISVKDHDNGFEVETDESGKYYSLALMIATGSRHRHLGVPGEKAFDGKGVAYCSTCDAPVFQGKDVAVVGSGNSGLEAVIDLKPYADKIYLLDIVEKPTGDPSTAEKVISMPNIIFLAQAEVKEIFGDEFVSGLKYKDLQTNDIKKLAVGGIFIEVGVLPNSEIVKDLVKVNEAGEIKVDPVYFSTSKPGIYAAGDVTNVIYRQNNIAAGDAIKAVLSAYNYLLKIKK